MFKKLFKKMFKKNGKKMFKKNIQKKFSKKNGEKEWWKKSWKLLRFMVENIINTKCRSFLPTTAVIRGESTVKPPGERRI